MKKILIIKQNLEKYGFLLSCLVKRDIAIKYRRSILGLLWSMLNPLLIMLVITFVFRYMFQNKIENFGIYVLTGSFIFNFVSEATVGSMGSVVDGGILIRKVKIPKVVFPLEKCVFSLINALAALVAIIMVMIITGVPIRWTILLTIYPVLCAFIFAFGLGMILSVMNVFFRDTAHLYQVFITVWMYLTPIIYPIEMIPGSVLTVIKLNPLYYFVSYFRKITLYGIVPTWKEHVICILIAAFFLTVGLILFYKKQDKFIYYL